MLINIFIMQNENYNGIGTWDDLIFSHRNKAYGAFVLRKIHDRHILIGFFLTILPLVLLSIMSLIKPIEQTQPVILPSETIILDKDVIDWPIQKIEKPSSASATNKKNDVPQENKPLVMTNDQSEINETKEIEQDEEEEFSGGEEDGTANNLNNNENPSSGGVGGLGIQGNDNSDEPFEYFSTSDDLVKPAFVGGDEGMMKYLRKNIRSPRSSEPNSEHLVHVMFIIDGKGNVADASVIKSAGKAYDQEALRVVEEMPKWIPGKHGGKNAKFRLILPVKFVNRF